MKRFFVFSLLFFSTFFLGSIVFSYGVSSPQVLPMTAFAPIVTTTQAPSTTTTQAPSNDSLNHSADDDDNGCETCTF
jgi:hypothetical protein